MTLVLDAGGITALTTDPGVVLGFRRRHQWPPQVPAAVLTEALTGDHRRDHATNRLLRTCVIRAVDEPVAREAARLRTATGRAGTISAIDAIVAAFAAQIAGAIVLTSDPIDLRALASHAATPFVVGAV